MITAEQNRKLTQCGRGTPMGDFLRRYWLPAFSTERLPDKGSDPMTLKLLGERLVAFRDDNGKVWILDEFCPHRLASLALARNENCALQCVYHGWRIAGDGTVLETPPEPPNSRFAQTVKQVSYPTHEVNGVVWVYMGPQDKQPPFPRFLMTTLPEDQIFSFYVRQPCNFMQGIEGEQDGAHAAWLHHGGMGEHILPPVRHLRAQLTDVRPRSAFRHEQWGLQTMMRWDADSPDETFSWIHPFISPVFTMAAYHLDDGSEHGGGHAWVPIDDENHYVWTWLWSKDEPYPPGHREAMKAGFGADRLSPANDYVHPDLVDGQWRQDRASMRDRRSFSGFDNAIAQDLAVQVSMGPVVDRTREHLASEDALVVQTRRFFLKALENFERGVEPLPGLEPGFSYDEIDVRAVIVPSDVPVDTVFERRDWRNVVTANA